VRWENKVHFDFLGNICAKNCRNRTVYVKITASCKGGKFFLRHSVHRVWKRSATTLLPLALPDVDRFSKFHRQTQKQISSKALTKNPTTEQVATLPCEILM